MKVAREAYNEQGHRSGKHPDVQPAGWSPEQGQRIVLPNEHRSFDNTGVAVTIQFNAKRIEDIEHAIAGTVTDFSGRNLIDSSIRAPSWRNDGTLAIPVHRAENARLAR